MSTQDNGGPALPLADPSAESVREAFDDWYAGLPSMSMPEREFALFVWGAAAARESALIAERDDAIASAECWEGQALDRLVEWDKMRAERDQLRAMVESVSKEVHLLRDALVDIAEESDDMGARKCAREALAASAVEGV